MSGGRPRRFDEDRALDAAIEVFWRQGYEGASMIHLTAAMNINKPSLYSVFGDKATLFRRAVLRYQEQDMAYRPAALQCATVQEVARALVMGNARAVTQDGKPSGCLTIQGGTACGPVNRPICEFLAQTRLADERALADRLTRALAEGDLPATTDAAALARYLMCVLDGQSVHAAAGVARRELEEAGRIALLAVPGSEIR